MKIKCIECDGIFPMKGSWTFLEVFDLCPHCARIWLETLHREIDIHILRKK